MNRTKGKPHLLMSQFPLANHLLGIDSQLVFVATIHVLLL